MPVLRAGLLLGFLIWPLSGQAGEDAQFAMPADPRYVSECGSCHTAYAPGLLPPPVWQQVFASLTQHFGTDASLEAKLHDALLAAVLPLAAARNPISRYRQPLARPEVGDPTRISQSALFHYLHDEMPAYVWARKGVLSRAQCGNCHPRADEGRYFEREVRIPRQ